MDMNIFKACDIRGIAGRNLYAREAFLIGRSVGTIINGADIVIAGDVRISTPELMSSLIDGLMACGCKVINAGLVPTPVYYFIKNLLDIDPGIMVTASHNPPEFNGFKPVLGKLPVTEEEVSKIGDIASSGKFIDGRGSCENIDLSSDYRRSIESLPGMQSESDDFKIVVDCGNGSFSSIAPDVLSNLGYDVYPMFCVPDGSFPNRNPNSAVEANLASLSAKVIETGAKLGVAFDGDGDRVSFIDEKGKMLSADKCIIILSQIILPNHSAPKVVYDLKCSSIVSQFVERLGGVALPERSGHTFIKTRMIKEDAILGGEISGHYFHKKLRGGDDGLYTAAMMANYLSAKKLKLSELASLIPEYFITPDIRIPYSGDRYGLIEKIAESFPIDMISRIDGVRVQFSDGWGLARVSVTEPVITLRFEAESRDRLSEIINEFLRSAEEIRNFVLNNHAV